MTSPQAMRWNPPPAWPEPPAGWTPPPGWQPDPAWGPPPPDWQFFVPVEEPQPVASGSWLSRHKVPVALGAAVVAALLAGVALLVAGLGAGEVTAVQSPGVGSPAVPLSPSAVLPTAAPSPSLSQPEMLALRLANAFAANGLPAANPRLQTARCQAQGCTALATTDQVDVYVFGSQQRAADFAGPQSGVYRRGIIVLSFAAGVPEAQRMQYQQFLDSNCPGPCAPPGDPAPTTPGAASPSVTGSSPAPAPATSAASGTASPTALTTAPGPSAVATTAAGPTTSASSQAGVAAARPYSRTPSAIVR